MCEFCEGNKKETMRSIFGIKMTAYVEMQKYLVIEENNNKKYTYDLCFCPMCGNRLYYNQWERIYVTNITKDEVMDVSGMNMPDSYYRNPLHLLICDKRSENSSNVAKQVGFIITETQVNSIKEKGYCDLFCTKNHDN